MGRIRSIKPEFFLHEGLADLTPLHRLLFVGLWTLADKEGRLEDRPRRIKAALFPWEDCDVEVLLADLADSGFIQRYESAGFACIAIPGFAKHQRPHPKETAIGLPHPPPATSQQKIAPISREWTQPQGVISRASTKGIPSSPAGKGREGDLGGGGGSSTSPAASPPGGEDVGDTPTVPSLPHKRAMAKQAADDAEKDPAYKQLVAELFAIFLEIRGAPYAETGRDWKALAALRARHAPEEIKRRWRLGLQAQFKSKCDSLVDLQERWNAQTNATAPPKQHSAPRTAASAADRDWSTE